MSQVADFAALCEASYVEFHRLNHLYTDSRVAELLAGELPIEGGGSMAHSQAQALVARWSVIDDIPNTTSGFSATLFRSKPDANGSPASLVLAFRGTEGLLDRDLWLADIGDIVHDGLAINQIVDIETLVNSLGRLLVPGYAPVTHAYVYTAPGLGGLTGRKVLDTIGRIYHITGGSYDPSHFTGVRAKPGNSLISGLGNQPAPPILIEGEDRGLIGNHSNAKAPSPMPAGALRATWVGAHSRQPRGLPGEFDAHRLIPRLALRLIAGRRNVSDQRSRAWVPVARRGARRGRRDASGGAPAEDASMRVRRPEVIAERWARRILMGYQDSATLPTSAPPGASSSARGWRLRRVRLSMPRPGFRREARP